MRRYLCFQKFKIIKRTQLELRKKNAAIAIQKNIRCHINRKEYLAKKKEIHIETCKKSSIIIQKNIRRHISRKQYLAKKKEIYNEICKKSSIVIQKNIRRYISRKQYLAKKKEIYIQQAEKDAVDANLTPIVTPDTSPIFMSTIVKKMVTEDVEDNGENNYTTKIDNTNNKKYNDDADDDDKVKTQQQQQYKKEEIHDFEQELNHLFNNNKVEHEKSSISDCQLGNVQEKKRNERRSEYIREMFETATELRELKEYLKENNDEVDTRHVNEDVIKW